jgi:DNA-binding Xre family transcriptional regulator
MIENHIRRIAQTRGYLNAHALQLALGVSPTAAAKLWKGEMDMIGLGTLDKLCRVLYCGASELLHYVNEPDTEEEREKSREQLKERCDRELEQIKKAGELPSLDSVIETFSYEGLDRFKKSDKYIPKKRRKKRTIEQKFLSWENELTPEKKPKASRKRG